MALDSARDVALLRLGMLLQREGYRFTCVTPATHARVNGRPGNRWASDLAGVFGWSRAFGPEAVSAEVLALMRQADILLKGEDGWRSRVRFSTLGPHLFVHSAYPTVQADAVFFGPDSYRFAAAIEAHRNGRERPVRRAVDIGCGAGPGALQVARLWPDAEVLALDINAEALRYTRLNAALAVAGQVRVVASDLLGAVDGAFDLIIANPPYMADPQARAYRDGGGTLGVELSVAMVEAALPRLAPGGSLLLYSGVAILAGVDPFIERIAPLLGDSGLRWHYHEVDPDVFGEELDEAAYTQVDRIAAVVLEVTRFRGALAEPG
ncbi:MAG: class I SAM-dependent methyltransferase [Pseudomonas sp.]|uniref:methyltransferase n=1 Tax=Pseudomonas sp. TaxID=306 RepID=UPI0033956B49